LESAPFLPYPPQSTQHWWSIYSGRRAIGFILARGKLDYEAFTADDRSLGTFASMKLAADALSERGSEP
jgi:hypothetical protein